MLLEVGIEELWMMMDDDENWDNSGCSGEHRGAQDATSPLPVQDDEIQDNSGCSVEHRGAWDAKSPLLVQDGG